MHDQRHAHEDPSCLDRANDPLDRRIRLQDRGEERRLRAGEHPGIDVARTDGGHAQTGAETLELEPQRLGPAQHGPLARRVDRHVGMRGQGDRGRDVDHVSGAALDHRRKESPRHVHGAQDVDAHAALDLRGRVEVEALAHDDARVVEQQLDGPVSIERLARRRGDRLVAGHVDDGGADARPVGAQLVGRGLQRARIDVPENQATRLFPVATPGDELAQTGGAARDEDRFAPDAGHRLAPVGSR